MLDGRLTVRCGGDVFEAGPRSFVFLPRGDLLLIAVLGGNEDYFRDLHQAAGDREVKRVQEEYGITAL